MKKVLPLLMVLSAVYCVRAAHFEHAGGRLWSQVGGWAEDGDEARVSGVMSRFNESSVHSYASCSVSAAGSSQDGVFSATPDGSTLTVSGTVTAEADVTATDGMLNAYALFSPTQPGVTNGIYFTLVADANETNGDLATIELTFLADGAATGAGSVSFGGGMGNSDVIVAVNPPLPAPDPIDPANIAYSYPASGQVSSYSVSDTASFKVKIGHTVAVFLGANVSVDLGPGTIESTELSASASIVLEITEVKPYTATCEECDLDGSGRVDLDDLAMLAAAWLSDAYAFPPPPPVINPGETCQMAYDLWLDWAESGTLSAGQPVWYKIYIEEEDCYTISLCNSNFDTAIELYEDCDGYLQGFDDDGCDPQSKLEANLSAWHTYYLRVRGKTIYDQGNYEILVTQGCGSGSFYGSDDCEDAPQVFVGDPITDNTTGATGVDETPSCGYDDDPLDLWYLFVAPEEGYFDIHIEYDEMGSFAGTLAGFEECGGSMIECHETEYDAIGFMVYLYEDQPILIRVASYEGNEGEYGLFVDGPYY